MKKALLLLLFLLFSLKPLLAQSKEIASNAVETANFIDFQKKAMWTLGSWSAAHAVVSSVGLLANSESEAFHQMNLSWSAVNLLIALPALHSLYNTEQVYNSPSDLERERHQFSKVLALNTGLDVAYMTTALFLYSAPASENATVEMNRGFAQALLLQGGFLFVFDLILYIKNEKAIRQSISEGSMY